MAIKNHWLSLIISLPTSNATARMRIWRALKSLGCGVLRDGVYLLPESAASKIALEQQEAEIIAAGGTAQIVKLSSRYPAQELAFRELFNRTDDYTALKQNIEIFLSSLPAQNLLASKRLLKRLARDFAALSAIDFFPGAAREQISLLLDQAGAELDALIHPDEPHAKSGNIKKLPQVEFQNRLWATRKKIWIDRMASAWLIRRFIDTGATFQWLNKPQDCPKSALGFDFDGASFTHVGPRVTFEVLLASFSLESDSALQRVASVVHFLDVGGIPVTEANGLELVLKGMRERCANDDELLQEVTKIFDDLYLSYTYEEKIHEQ
jgi:hypothetical protein